MSFHVVGSRSWTPIQLILISHRAEQILSRIYNIFISLNCVIVFRPIFRYLFPVRFNDGLDASKFVHLSLIAIDGHIAGKSIII